MVKYYIFNRSIGSYHCLSAYFKINDITLLGLYNSRHGHFLIFSVIVPTLVYLIDWYYINVLIQNIKQIKIK